MDSNIPLLLSRHHTWFPKGPFGCRASRSHCICHHVAPLKKKNDVQSILHNHKRNDEHSMIKEKLIIEIKQIAATYFSIADHSALQKQLLSHTSMIWSFHTAVLSKNWVYQNKSSIHFCPLKATMIRQMKKINSSYVALWFKGLLENFWFVLHLLKYNRFMLF